MNPKPFCRYRHFKWCPEKPFYIRKEYPFGDIIGRNKDGCMNWHQESLQDTTTGKVLLYQGCIDMFTAFYMRDYGIRSLGNQRATEQLRNGLCEEVKYKNDKGEIQIRYEPKIKPELIFFIEQIAKKFSLLIDKK